jgi:hypothetical protein
MKRLLLAALAAGLSSHAWAVDSDGTKPDPKLTPGAIRTGSVDMICNTRTGTIRNVSGSEKLAVFRRYGMAGPHSAFPGTNLMPPYEVDHLISLELGGSNDVTNLWPQAYIQEYGAKEKDVLENKLHRLICAGKITPEDAQHEIATDWIASYRKRIGSAPQTRN